MMAAQTERNNAKRSHRENTKLHNNNNKKRRRRRHDFARDLTLYLKGKTFLFFFSFFFISLLFWIPLFHQIVLDAADREIQTPRR